MTVRLALDVADSVGESIIWDEARQRLNWVDIIGRRLHAFDPATDDHQVWRLAGRPTSIGLRADGGAIVGMERSICLWDFEGEPTPVCEVEPDAPANRLNEGVVGPDGCFWVGTMLNNIADDDSPRDAAEAAGRIYRYAPDGRLTRLSDDVFVITNTFVWSGNRLITADTPANELYSYRVCADGALSDRRTILQGFGRGLPDGSTMDAEGFVWTARVAGGSCLTRMAPDGRIDRVVELPCSWPTSCAFGGPDFSTLYVTSARFTMSAEHLAANPQEGALFALDVGVLGLPGHRFGAGA